MPEQCFFISVSGVCQVNGGNCPFQIYSQSCPDFTAEVPVTSKPKVVQDTSYSLPDDKAQLKQLQSKIIAATNSMYALAAAISNLSDGNTKVEFIKKHDIVLDKLARLQGEVFIRYKNSCMYGIAQGCDRHSRGVGICRDCEGFDKVVKMP